MNTRHSADQRYELTQFDGIEITTRSVGTEELRAVKPESYDVYISTSSGVLGFRDASGDWIEFRNRWPRLGPVTIAILRAIQLNPGDFLTPAQITELTGYDSLRENTVLAARIYALRQSLRDRDQRFVETSTADGYAIRWSSQRTWLWVDRIATKQDARHPNDDAVPVKPIEA